MGKKRSRKTYVSKGQRNGIARDIVKAIKREISPFIKEDNLRKAWKSGKNPWVAVKNSENGTNRPYVKQRANSVWGNPKRTYSIFKGA